MSYVASWVSENLRGQARNEECCFRIPGHCNGRTDTTVWVHSDLLIHGNGQGCKGHDFHGAFGCYGCHQWYERKVEPDAEKRLAAFQAAHDASWRRLLETGRAKVSKWKG